MRARRGARGSTGATGATLVAVPLVAVALAAGCTDLPSAADEPFSIEFERLPFPAVVVGDTLRDSTGRAAPLAATAYNIDGTPLPPTAVTYVVSGRAVVLLPGNFVRGDTLDAETRVSALAGSLPSLSRTLRVVRRPDSLAGPTTAPGALTYGVPPSPTSDRSEALAVRVLATPTGGTATGVPSWVVRYRLVVRGDTLAVGDTSLVWLADDAGRPAPLDTTDGTGEASRRVRINGLNPAVDGLDSVVVSVTAQGTTAPLRGAPVRLALPVRLRQ